MLGLTEGEIEGDKLGESDGLRLGLRLGDKLTLGLTLGLRLGDKLTLGLRLGESDGDKLGLTLGLRLSDGLPTDAGAIYPHEEAASLPVFTHNPSPTAFLSIKVAPFLNPDSLVGTVTPAAITILSNESLKTTSLKR